MKLTSASPLRYPGGKSKIAQRLLRYFPQNLETVVSPFVGGGSVELLLADRGTKIFAYDHDPQLVSFWQHVLADPTAVAREAEQYLGVPTSEFGALKRQLAASEDNVARAGLYFAINRLSFSGMTKHGGASPTSDRFSAKVVKALEGFRCPNLEVGHADFHDSLARHAKSFAFLDPPYFEADKLYDGHSEFDHDALLHCLKDRPNWIMTYDDCPQVRTLYKAFPILSHDVRYGLSDRTGQELIIGSRNMAAAMGVSSPTHFYFNDNEPSQQEVVAAPTGRASAAHWRYIGTHGRVAEQMALAKLAVDDIINGSQRLAIVIGAPGVGKSELARCAMSKWKARGQSAIFGQPSSKQHLVELLVESRGNRPLILEEADILFRSNAMIELLKIVADPKSPSHIIGRGNKRVPVTAPMILLGNFQLGDLPRSQQNQARALFDRHAPVEINAQIEDLYDWTIYLALASNLLTECQFQHRTYRTSLIDITSSIDWFRLNLWNLKSVSPRTLQKVVGWHMRHRLNMEMTDREFQLRLKSLLLEFPQLRESPPPYDWAALRLLLQNGESDKTISMVA